METVNISLPQSIVRQMNKLMHEEGYRSVPELFKKLIVTYKLVKKNELDLQEFKAKPLEEIEKSLYNSKKYKPPFVESVMDGLRKSSFYENKIAKK